MANAAPEPIKIGLTTCLLGTKAAAINKVPKQKYASRPVLRPFTPNSCCAIGALDRNIASNIHVNKARPEIKTLIFFRLKVEPNWLNNKKPVAIESELNTHNFGAFIGSRLAFGVTKTATAKIVTPSSHSILRSTPCVNIYISLFAMTVHNGRRPAPFGNRPSVYSLRRVVKAIKPLPSSGS